MKSNRKILAIVAVIALVAILGVCLVACNAKDYKKRLEKKDYTVVTYEGDKLETYSKQVGAELKFVVVGQKGLIGGESVAIFKFKKSADAKKYYNDLKNHLADGYDAYKTGSIVISGTKQGVKDAK